MLPHPCLAIAAPVEAAGFEVRIIDGRLAPPHPSQLDFEPDLIGISSMTSQVGQAVQFARMARRHTPDIPIVWGGWHSTTFPESVLQSGLADYIIMGEGDEAIIELIEVLRSGKSVNDIMGLGWLDNGNVRVNPAREAMKSIPDFPIPFHLLEREQYEITDGSIDIFTSRGCPYSCGFCSIEQVYHRRWIALTADEVVSNMEELYKNEGINYFRIGDSNFFVDAKRVRKIADLILEKKLPIMWSAWGHVSSMKVLNRDDWRKIQMSGHQFTNVGIESGSPRIRKYVGKPTSTSHIIPLIRMLEEEGIVIRCLFMVGIPREKEEDLRQTVDLIMEIKSYSPATQFTLFLYHPLPGSRMADDEISEGITLNFPESLEQWGELKSPTITPWIAGADRMVGYRKRTYPKMISFYLWKGCLDLAWTRRASRIGNVLRKKIYQLIDWRLRTWNFLFPFEWYFYRLKSFLLSSAKK
jgi:radical SAM superfamily enzyme YgiQ (UPF0313 family)